MKYTSVIENHHNISYYIEQSSNCSLEQNQTTIAMVCIFGYLLKAEELWTQPVSVQASFNAYVN
jgi:hypothetical protein